MNSKFFDNEIFAKNLRRLLDRRDMTAAELARSLDISKSAVSDWLKGKSLPRMDKIDRMCVIFNCVREDFYRANPDIDEQAVKVALFSGDTEVTEEMWEAVKNFARFIEEQQRGKND